MLKSSHVFMNMTHNFILNSGLAHFLNCIHYLLILHSLQSSSELSLSPWRCFLLILHPPPITQIQTFLLSHLFSMRFSLPHNPRAVSLSYAHSKSIFVSQKHLLFNLNIESKNINELYDYKLWQWLKKENVCFCFLNYIIVKPIPNA